MAVAPVPVTVGSRPHIGVMMPDAVSMYQEPTTSVPEGTEGPMDKRGDKFILDEGIGKGRNGRSSAT